MHKENSMNPETKVLLSVISGILIVFTLIAVAIVTYGCSHFPLHIKQTHQYQVGEQQNASKTWEI